MLSRRADACKTIPATRSAQSAIALLIPRVVARGWPQHVSGGRLKDLYCAMHLADDVDPKWAALQAHPALNTI